MRGEPKPPSIHLCQEAQHKEDKIGSRQLAGAEIQIQICLFLKKVLKLQMLVEVVLYYLDEVAVLVHMQILRKMFQWRNKVKLDL